MPKCVRCGRWASGFPWRPDTPVLCLCCRRADRDAVAVPRPDHVALTAARRAALADALPPDVRAALDDPELETVSRECLDALIRAVTGGPGAVPGGLLYLQCHGYLYPEADDAPL